MIFMVQFLIMRNEQAPTRICCVCELEKPETEYYREHSKKGVQPRCKACRKLKLRTPVRKGWVKDGVGFLPLTKDQIVRVDVGDLESLSKHNWYALWNKDTKSFYAARHNGPSFLYMHRLLLGATETEEKVDHEDHETLNNQRYNLRRATNTQNSQNQKLHKDNAVGLKGVGPSRTKGYRARIVLNKKQIHLGTFQTPEDAHDAYTKAARSLFADFVYTPLKEK